jgi:hypothetical protein
MIFGLLSSLLLLCFVFFGRFFISTEFWLYPYLISKGLTPYKDLIDQHFPGVLFGPVSFTTFRIDTMQEAILAELIFLCLLGLISYAWFVKHNQEYHAAFLSILFVCGYYLLDGNHLWIEQWSLILLITSLHLVNRNGKSNYLGGFLLAFAVINRPFVIGWSILIFLLSKDKTKTIIGALTYLSIACIWIYKNGGFELLHQAVAFSKTTYVSLATKVPTGNEVIKALVVITPFLYLMRRQPVLWLAAILGLFGAWPRFELYHLTPILISSFFVRIDKKNFRVLFAAATCLFVLALLKTKPFARENFYIQNDTLKLANMVAAYDSPYLYLFGGPDQIYVLSNKTPAGNYYLPSLAWYHHEEEYVARQIAALENQQGELVVVNSNSVVDGRNLIDSSPRIYNYIVTHYKNTQTWGDYRFYLESDVLADKK